nr:wall-associated receptor kinase 2-like [Ipomoea batatas]
MLQVISIFATAKGGGLAMPGCQEKCGNLTIAYPFGIGKPKCYLEEPFQVNCNSSTQVATLPYVALYLSVYNISSDSITIEAYGSSMDYNSSSGKNLLRRVSTIKFDEIKCSPGFTVPMAIDWSIGKLSCAKVKKSICGHNAYCANSTRGEGYLCRCSQGYQGNPYLPRGCQVTGFWLNRKFKKRKHEKNKERLFKRNGGFLLQKQMSICNRGGVLEMKIFKTEELEKATDNFNQSRILGKGGLGTVYKGQKVISSNKSDEGLVIRFKTSLKQKDGLFEILDHAVRNEGGEEEIFAVAKLAKRCIKLNARKRPGMMEVATELQRLLARTNGEGLQRRPNDCEDSCFSSGAMSFDHNLDVITDETTVLIDE